MPEIYRGRQATQVAKLVADTPVFLGFANQLASEVRANAAQHKDTGHFTDSVKVGRDRHSSGVNDAVVYSDDPGALSIEFGHTQGGVYHPGIYAFSQAAS